MKFRLPLGPMLTKTKKKKKKRKKIVKNQKLKISKIQTSTFVGSTEMFILKKFEGFKSDLGEE